MLALRNATMVDSEGVVESDVAIENGKIASVGDAPDADRELDATGRYVAPGLIDAHVHLMACGAVRFSVESGFVANESAVAAGATEAVVTGNPDGIIQIRHRQYSIVGIAR